MSLPILDGNQSATTLSTILSGGEHTPAHTVVSLGSTAISNITSAVSGSVVSVSNFPSTQTIAGTVTVGNSVTIGAILSSQNQNIIGTSGVFSTLRIKDNAGTYGEPQGSGTLTYNLPVYGTVTIGNSVTIGSLPPVSGTVTVGAMPNTTVTVSSFPRPTWTDYSGSVATANSAVTAISTTTRSYLLAQVTTGQMFLNIGATATTLNSVYFSAGQGFAWETSVPQGFVSIISGVTGTNYVLKEG